MENNRLKYHKVLISGEPRYVIFRNGRFMALSGDRPMFIEIFPTMKCNLNCPLCDRGNEISELKDFGDIKILYDNLRQDPDCYISGMRISGREPLLYSKINELIIFLRKLDRKADIMLLTNGIALAKLTKKSLSLVKPYVSIYRRAVDILQRDKVVAGILRSKKIPIEVNVSYHEDLNAPGTKPADFDPFSNCFSAVLLCATSKVYPCCRAHRFEQMFKKNYHCRIDTKNIYQRLKGIIRNTDLCVHCPRMYKDPQLVAAD